MTTAGYNRAMKHTSIDDTKAQRVDMPGAEGVTMRLMVGREDGAPNFAMRIFDVEPGGCTPLHQHNYEHEVLVLEGEGEVVLPDGQTTRPVAKGDALYVPANDLHQFRASAGKRLQFLCMVPVQFVCATGENDATPGS